MSTSTTPAVRTIPADLSFNGCLRMLRNGSLTWWCFWALDRFSREGVLATLQYLQRLSGYGIGYRSFTEGYLDSCGMFKDAVIGILAVVAKQERIRISERVQAGLHRARAAGRVGGRPRGVFDRARVQELRQQGLSIGEIAAEVGVPRTSVHRALKCNGSRSSPASFSRYSPVRSSHSSLTVSAAMAQGAGAAGIGYFGV